MASDSKVHEVVIIGSGPAGYTAALYTSRANLEPLVFAGLQHGGQLMTTTDVENFPGFPEGIMGPDLMERVQKQAQRFGADVRFEDVVEVDLSSRPFRVQSTKSDVMAKAIIISTGAKAKMLGLPGEEKLVGHGLSTCATCDGFFFRDKEIAVIGGGDSAMEESNFLTKFANKVHVIHRREEFRASNIMVDKAKANPKIEFILNATPTRFLEADGKLTGVELSSTVDEKTWEMELDGVFVAIGHTPNTQLFSGQLDLHDNGYMKVDPGSTRTSVEGVFACGDVCDFTYRQAITAAGTGCQAALDAERWLEGH